MITKGSATGILMSAKAAPLTRCGTSSTTSIIAASGSRISGTIFNDPVIMAKARNKMTTDPVSRSRAVGCTLKVNGEIRA